MRKESEGAKRVRERSRKSRNRAPFGEALFRKEETERERESLGRLQKKEEGDTIFVGQYLFIGSETTSIWLEVAKVRGQDVVCVAKNPATLAGSLFTLHASQVHIDLPTLTEKDKEAISTWGVKKQN